MWLVHVMTGSCDSAYIQQNKYAGVNGLVRDRQ